MIKIVIPNYHCNDLYKSIIIGGGNEMNFYNTYLPFFYLDNETINYRRELYSKRRRLAPINGIRDSNYDTARKRYKRIYK